MRLNIFRTQQRPSGSVPRLLKALGPSWAACPIRRGVQTVCLVGFVVLFFYVCWPYGSKEYAEAFSARERVPAELFLLLDPLVAISTALAARTWVWSLTAAGLMLLVSLVLPRAFCGYVCPLGTLFDAFDWAIGRRVRLLRLSDKGWWANVRYCLLVAVLAGAGAGVLLSGFVAAIPVVTRAMLFIVAPGQTGLLKGWYLVPPMNAGQVVSIVLVVVIFGLGALGRRFWCRCGCPTGALFSAASVFRLSERHVSDGCIKCGKCLSVCSFGAINDDFSTRFGNCTFCQSCGGVCPVEAITFTTRWSRREKGVAAQRVVPEAVLSRRRLLTGVGGAAAGVGIAVAVQIPRAAGVLPIRPPGSAPEELFLKLCIRCGQCIKVCPNNVLQPAGFGDGIDGLWTPKVAADWSGCEPSCTNCGQVCPTGAVRALPLAEKQAARMALACVNQDTCLPYTGRGQCQLCVDECRAAGYDAIEFIGVGSEMDERGAPIEGSGYLAPVVRQDKCVGCGLCQMRCHGINVKSEKLLERSAIRIVAGAGREDRITSGSYVALREQRARERRRQDEGGAEEYLPDFLR